MKLKKYIELIKEREGFDDIEEPSSGREWNFPEEEEEVEEVEYDEDVEDDIQHLFSLLRKIFKNADIHDVIVFGDVTNITIEVCTNKWESLKDLIKIFEIAKVKLQDDILYDYTAEFELNNDRNGFPIYIFIFTTNAYEDSEEEINGNVADSAYLSDELDSDVPF